MTTLQDNIKNALINGSNDCTTLWWDTQDPSNEGPAYRTTVDGTEFTGALELLEWSAKNTEGYILRDYFMGPDDVYLGPDSDGVYPILDAE